MEEGGRIVEGEEGRGQGAGSLLRKRGGAFLAAGGRIKG
jgi:hypothetical protein